MNSTPETIIIRAPDDMHVHLREGDLLRCVLPHTTRHFRRALVMPNLQRPITTGHEAAAYRTQILGLAKTPFEPLMTIKLTHDTDARTIRDAAGCGVVAVKLYPEGVTTNSSNGVRDLGDIHPDVFHAMIDTGMVLCVHAEEPGVFSMDREAAYIDVWLSRLVVAHTDLKVVIEHATTARAIDFVKAAGCNVAATITAHHLLITLDDVIGDKLRPHNFCKPIAKTPRDRDALVAAATSGDPKFFLGTDSAPHTSATKQCASGCAGCFTAPIAMSLLAAVFERVRTLDRLEAFTSQYGAEFYGLRLNDAHLTLERTGLVIPDVYEGQVVPFMSGQTLSWFAPALQDEDEWDQHE
jgi:dihydroorotase